jgi:hypothetical protein
MIFKNRVMKTLKYKNKQRELINKEDYSCKNRWEIFKLNKWRRERNNKWTERMNLIDNWYKKYNNNLN